METRVAVDARALQRPGIGYFVVVDALLTELDDAGYRLVLVTDENEHGAALRERYPSAEVAVLKRTTWLVWEQIQLPAFLFRSRPDVWIAPTNFGVPLVTPSKTATVLVVMDLIPVRFARPYMTKRPVWAVQYLISTGLGLLAATRVVTISDSTARDVRRVSRRHSRIIHPPIPAVRAERAISDAPLSGEYVVYSGGFDTRKNFAMVMDAFGIYKSQHPDLAMKLVVLGDRVDLVEPMVAERGWQDDVIVTGFVSEDDKYRYFQGATAVLYPSSFEGFGLVVVEAFAAGVPVICGTGGALRDVAADAGLLVDPLSPEGIARLIDQAKDPVERERVRMAGYRQLEVLRAQSTGYAEVVANVVHAP